MTGTNFTAVRHQQPRDGERCVVIRGDLVFTATATKRYWIVIGPLGSGDRVEMEDNDQWDESGHALDWM